MSTLILGILLATLSALTIRLVANANTAFQALKASLAQAITAIIGVIAIIDMVEVQEKVWMYALGIAIGTFAIILADINK